MSSSLHEELITTGGSIKTAGTCQTCGQGTSSAHQPGVANYTGAGNYIYAIGRIEARFRSLSVEKEYMQIVGRTDTKGLSDRQTLHKVLSQRDNRYIARQMCWVFSIEGIETYVLIPRDPSDLDLLVEALRPAPGPMDIDIVIGTRGPVAPAELCNGLTIPVAIFDQIYSFDQESLLSAIPKPKNADPDKFSQAAAELLDRVMQMADNSGSSDAHRALNYLIVRYPVIYSSVANAFDRNHSLSGVDSSLSRLSAARKIVDIVFSFTDRTTDVTEKFFVRVDVTEAFPFLVTKFSPYFDR